MKKFMYSRVWCEVNTTNQFKQQDNVDSSSHDKCDDDINMKTDQGIATGLCIFGLCCLVGLVGNILIGLWL